MFRRFLALMSAFALVALMTGPVAASAAFKPAVVPLDNCSGSLVIIIYENANYGGRSYPLCSNQPNYKSINLGGSTACNGLFTGMNWNDCVSSVGAYMTGNSTVDYCVYTDANYAGSKMRVGFGGSNWFWPTMPSGFNDSISSSRWVAHNASC